ncbi:hypothetical protein PVAP13_4NG043308 [Panicum virgatum]|uniref:Uncharacterized protein n=1 Tax=Panicum virgatum TaxID=38727 RepID=A0A8T0T1Q4_PANVG|nr:hypothetical protein PVAP13_4NG043308 [Panicum virgatum]
MTPTQASCARENRGGRESAVEMEGGGAPGRSQPTSGRSPPGRSRAEGGRSRPPGGGGCRLEEGSTPGLGVEARGQPRPPSRRRAKARRSGGSLARGGRSRTASGGSRQGRREASVRRHRVSSSRSVAAGRPSTTAADRFDRPHKRGGRCPRRRSWATSPGAR